MDQRKENIAKQVQAIKRNNSTVKGYEEAYRKYLSFVERGILEPVEPLEVRVGAASTMRIGPQETSQNREHENGLPHFPTLALTDGPDMIGNQGHGRHVVGQSYFPSTGQRY